MAIRWSAPIYVGVVTVPTPAPLPVPSTEVLPSFVEKTAAGGATFLLSDAAISPVYPSLVRCVWLAPDFEQTPDPATVLEQDAPSVDLEITGPGSFTVTPTEAVPAGDYLLCLVPGFHEA